jgi:hypothetical protein
VRACGRVIGLYGACASHQEIFVIVGRLLDFFFFFKSSEATVRRYLIREGFFFFFNSRALNIYIYILLLQFNNGSHQI